MRKFVSLFLVIVMVIGMNVSAFAQVSYEQPFAPNTEGSETYRIPAILTLNDGSVLAAADMRYSHGSDSPGNIDTLIAHSPDGYTNWEYQVINRFDDYADGVTDKASASFIDSAVIQSSTGRIFIVTDAWTSYGGYPTAKKGTGFTQVDGKNRMLLTTGSVNDELSSFNYYIGDFSGSLAPVFKLSDKSATEYSVDNEYNLYKNGEPLYMAQVGSDIQVRQNVFYDKAELSAYNTCYLFMRYSDDNGATWSAPVNLSPFVKNDNESFLGIAPGRGFVTQYQGKERIIFCVYDNSGLAESVSTIYSDDNGATWQRGDKTSFKLAIGKTSEAQIVALNSGTLRMYARDNYSFIAYADSTDGGKSWTKFVADTSLVARGNCMVSFINYSKQINGKNVLIASYPSDPDERADGVVRVGLIEADNSVNWISLYHVNDGFFAYSCLTELDDGNIGYLYEDEAAKISYAILTVSENGTVSEINGNNASFDDTQSFWDTILNYLRDFFNKFLVMFGLL